MNWKAISIVLSVLFVVALGVIVYFVTAGGCPMMGSMSRQDMPMSGMSQMMNEKQMAEMCTAMVKEMSKDCPEMMDKDRVVKEMTNRCMAMMKQNSAPTPRADQ